MKKAFLIFVLCALLFTLLGGGAIYAAPSTYNVPKAAAAPEIDGKITGDEWDNALTVELKARDANLWVAIGDIKDFEGAVFKFMWAEEGIYYVATVTDTSAPMNVPEYGGGSYNTGDAIQFNIYASRDISGPGVGDTLFFSCHPKTSTGQPAVGEHFVYGDGGSGKDVPGAIVASVMNGNSYTIEGLLPTTAFAALPNFPIVIASGTKFYMNDIVMYCDATTQGLVGDHEYFDGALCNEYVLVDTLAGKLPVAEEEIVEDTANPAPAVTAPAVASPQTGDAVSYIFIAFAAVILITVVKNSKKRKV